MNNRRKRTFTTQELKKRARAILARKPLQEQHFVLIYDAFEYSTQYTPRADNNKPGEKQRIQHHLQKLNAKLNDDFRYFFVRDPWFPNRKSGFHIGADDDAAACVALVDVIGDIINAAERFLNAQTPLIELRWAVVAENRSDDIHLAWE